MTLDQSDPVSDNDADTVDIETIEVEAIPVGTRQVLPGTLDQPLLTLRFKNHRSQPHQLTGLRFQVSQGIDAVKLWLDDGDNVLQPGADALITSGTPSAGSWTTDPIALVLPVEQTRSLFVSGDVSLTSARHGQTLDVSLESSEDVFWSGPTTLVTHRRFPLRSPGPVQVGNLVLAQLGFTPQPADTSLRGTLSVPVLQMWVPDDGGLADQLQQFDVLQAGTGVAGTDIGSLRLQRLVASAPQEDTSAGEGPWVSGTGDGGAPQVWLDVSVAEFFHTGAGRWSASGFNLDVPVGGLEIRILVDIAADAREGRTIQMSLPVDGLQFDSGRRGPVDAGWTNPAVVLVRAERILEVAQTGVASVAGPFPRNASRLPVLGLTLQARSVATDTLRTLRLLHASTGPEGIAGDPHAQIAEAGLWLDADGSGSIDVGDTLLDTAAPDVDGELMFNGDGSLSAPLVVNELVHLLVTLTPDSTRVRDSERLQVRLQNASDITTAGNLLVQLPASIETLKPPVIDGQSANGYDVHAVEGGALVAGARQARVLDLTLPSNGVDDDVLQALRVENTGTATASDVVRMTLLRDDGDGTLNAADSLIAEFEPVTQRDWTASGLALDLRTADAGRRFFVVIEVSGSPQSGATFQARVPLDGVTVASGNDGPIDAELLGGSQYVLSVPDRVTWIAGIADENAVRPDASRSPVLILELFNGYSTPRVLNAMLVKLTGTATEEEYRTWALYPDDNGNGALDPNETALAAGSPQDGEVRFEGFEHPLPAQQQRRLLVTYSLLPSSARDASVIDAVIENAAALRFADELTSSAGQFPLDSPGVDTVDGFVESQVGNNVVASRTLGGGEGDVLVLDVVLPSNGWEPDTLNELALEHVDVANVAILGQDFSSLRLWRESAPGAGLEGFDAAADVPVGAAVSQGSRLRFADLAQPIPPGGQRFYVTMDAAVTPTEGRNLHLRIAVLGVDMASGNDGPVDGEVEGTANHLFSTSDLLVSVQPSVDVASRGQAIDLTLEVRNRSIASLDSIVPILLDVVPTPAATLINGPEPPMLSLAPDASGVLTYRFQLEQAGEVQFAARVALSDGSSQSGIATSAPIRVFEPPTELALQLLSNLPPSVNRGQSVTPLVWKFEHPDSDPNAADIRVDELRLVVQDANANPQPASAVFDRAEVRTGGLVHTIMDSIPDTSEIVLSLAPPVVLHGGEAINVPLGVSIAPLAAAKEFQLRLEANGAVAAVDANSAQAVPLNATLPWTTEPSIIHTRATSIALTPTPTLPGSVNRGQVEIPAGTLTFSLPGQAGEREARVIQIELALEDSSGAPIVPAELISRIRVRTGATTLLEATDFGLVDNRITLGLEIPKVIASGAPEDLDLSFDLRPDASVDRFSVVLQDSSALHVRDATSGEPVYVEMTSPGIFPWRQGPTTLQTQANHVVVQATSRTPSASFPNAQDLPVADLLLDRGSDPPGSADVELVSVTFWTLGETGDVLIPADVLSSARLLSNGGVVDATGAPPLQTTGMTLTLATPLRLSIQTPLDLSLQVDLAAAVSEPWLRFSFEPSSFELRDANDTSRSLVATGKVPFATDLLRIVSQPVGVAAGPIGDPPVNIARGGAAEVVALRVFHPGVASEASLQPRNIVLLTRDADAAPLEVDAIASAARLRLDDQSF
jgi:hypothetical protein